MVGLSDLRGLWRRIMIAWPDGRADRTTEVYWLQGPSRYADLRIPRDRPERARCSCLRDLDWPMLHFMASQEGFIGHLDVDNSMAHWHRAFDYQPETDVADRGHLEFEADILVEHGAETAYVERWCREPETEQHVLALWLAGDASHPFGCLIATSNAFIYARGRAEPLPRKTNLSALLESAASLEEAQALFECEISFGRRIGQRWKIERSSLPFREGQVLRPKVDEDTLMVDDMTLGGAAYRRFWRIAECESTAQELLFNWFSAEPVD
jgi:hypothetical protein